MTRQLEDVLAARIRIKPFIHKTPIFSSQTLNRQLGCEVFLKAENLQKTGSFKARGVSNFLATREAIADEITTYSSGNHAQATSWAAARHQRRATVFMPEDASPAKVAAVKHYGGEVQFAGLTTQDRHDACHAYAERTGAQIVPPYDHEAIIAGQGTVSLEILEELPQFDALLLPTGGGGLCAGNAFTIRSLRQTTRVYACEPTTADDARQSLESGTLTAINFSATIADGTRALCLGDRNWALIQQHVAGGLVADDPTIIEAMRDLARYLKLIVEPSGALALACLAANREQFAGQKVVVVLSGGNINMDTYSTLTAGEYAGSA
ncbi:threonine ammonia-lyase [Acanthopleuribacter pedis]|uniref:Threonine/serine dehydratase n=1 Tax=Acanthopleuribacter pedis TaxID=442870 RepID=A0A8J7QKR4_9BACT|nr:threonine/serine dehydratase [Acanthopleuribacter pedis]MBO1319810.1 threonine/serine dehydratase [Acanthopleuribacter pedis]